MRHQSAVCAPLWRPQKSASLLGDMVESLATSSSQPTLAAGTIRVAAVLTMGSA